MRKRSRAGPSGVSFEIDQRITLARLRSRSTSSVSCARSDVGLEAALVPENAFVEEELGALRVPVPGYGEGLAGIEVVLDELARPPMALAAALPATALGLPYFSFVPFAAWHGVVVALVAAFCVLRAVATERRGWALAGGIATTLTILSRHDQGLYLLVALAAFVLALRFASRGAPGAAARGLVPAWAAGAAALALPLDRAEGGRSAPRSAPTRGSSISRTTWPTLLLRRDGVRGWLRDVAAVCLQQVQGCHRRCIRRRKGRWGGRVSA